MSRVLSLFFWPTCLEKNQAYTSSGHVAPAPQMSVCSTYRHCPDCQMVCRGLQNIQRHQCGHGICPSCKERVPTETHPCFIQPIVEQVPQSARHCRRGAAAGLATLQANVVSSPDPDEAEEEGTDSVPKPLFLYFDIEARQDTSLHCANLLCPETSESDEQFSSFGESCIEAFLDWATSLTRTNNPDVK